MGGGMREIAEMVKVLPRDVKNTNGKKQGCKQD